MAAHDHKTAPPPPPPPEPLGILRGHGVPVNASSFLSSTSLVSGGADGVVKIWDLRTRRESASSSSAHSNAGVLHASPLSSAAAATKRFVTQGRDGLVKVWDAETFREGCEPLVSYYCGSFSFTKFATLRWPASAVDAADKDQALEHSGGDAIANGNLIVCPGSEGSNVSYAGDSTAASV